MNTLKIVLLVVVAVLALSFCGTGCMFYGSYKQAVNLDEAVSQQWAQVENQLQRRFDLIPNLVEVVKGYAAHEKDVFSNIAEARAAYTGAQSVPQKAEAAGRLESALGRLLMIRESYPQLKADKSFLRLQDSIEGTENRLSVERKRYNDAVAALNKFIRQPVGAIVSGIAHVEKAEYFEVSDVAREAPKVDFSDDKAGDGE